MSEERRDAIKLVGYLVAFMWALEVVDLLLDHRLDRYGIHPREAEGLPEIASAPFLHDGFGHLLANTVPFAVMGAGIALSGLARLLGVVAIVALVSGLGTWAIGPSGTVHLGASGLVFGFASYLVSRGFFSRRIRDFALGVVVLSVFGLGLLAGLLPQDRISWQSHVFGAVGGVLAARLIAARREPPSR